MSRSSSIIRGGAWQLGAQISMSLGQLLFGALTARQYSPAQFGSFTAALSLYGLLAVLTTTGFPAYVLSAKKLSAGDIRRVRRMCAAGSIAAAVTYLVVSPLWLDALGAEGGSSFLLVILLAQLIGPTASLESALLRRAHRTKADAAVLLGSFLVSIMGAAAMIMVFGKLWMLALSPLLNQIALLVLSIAVRGKIATEDSSGAGGRDVLYFARRVSTQNSAFAVLTQIPNWTIGAAVGAAGLGHFSRATSLTSLPAGSLSGAFNRTLQPHWREYDTPGDYLGGVREALGLSSAVAAAIFGVVGGLGGYLATLWLGPGWEDVGQLVPWLAAAAAVQVIFAMVANSAEMRAKFEAVRRAQIALLVGLAPLLLLLFTDAKLWVAAASLLISQLLGFVVLLMAITREVPSARRGLSAAFARNVVGGLVIAGLARGGAVWADHENWALLDSDNLAAVALGGVLAGIGLAVIGMLSPDYRVLRVAISRFGKEATSR